jgi:L-seryl-tRNA(Ser) seleniumtransferase
LIAIRSSSRSTNQLESELRLAEHPVIARVEDDQLLLDLRTVFQDEEDELVRALNKLMKLSESAVGEHPG